MSSTGITEERNGSQEEQEYFDSVISTFKSYRWEGIKEIKHKQFSTLV